MNKKLDLAQVRERVKRIADIAHDDEAAHSAEDQLYEDVLKRIANGCTEPEKLAREALKTKKFDFGRWTS